MDNQPYQPPYPPSAGQRPNAPDAPNAPGAPKRLTADEARRRARILKRVALVGSSLAFCGLAGLAASHVTGVTAAAGSATPTAAPGQHDDNGGFFPDGNSDDGDQHNGQSGGFNFGSGGGNFQPPSSTSGGS